MRKKRQLSAPAGVSHAMETYQTYQNIKGHGSIEESVDEDFMVIKPIVLW
jgi:hypothetical protein